jgi:hypothetical protein
MGRPTKYTDEMLDHAVRESESVAGVLRILGLTWSGGSHAHISRRIKSLGLDTAHLTGAAHMRGKPALRRLAAAEVLVPVPELPFPDGDVGWEERRQNQLPLGTDGMAAQPC